MNGAELLLAPIAAGMALATAWLIKWASEARTPMTAGLVAFLLAMMVAMLAGALLYFHAPSAGSLVLGLWVSAALMAGSVFPFVFAFLSEVRLRLAHPETPAAPAPLTSPVRFYAVIVGLVLANELLMGWTFQLASGAQIPGSGTVPGLLVGIVDSPWFLFTMAAEMLATAVLLRSRLDRAVLVVLVGQSIIMLLSPPAIASPLWGDIAVYGSSAAMIALFVYLLEHLYRHRQLAPGLSAYLLELLAVYAVMMAGLYAWLAEGSAALFALSVVLEMIIVFAAVLRPEALGGEPGPPWTSRAAWTFGLLSLVFVAEIFMGALLDRRAGLAPIPVPLPLAGVPATVLAHAVSNGFWFFADVAASTGFLAMMGLEMGALVVLKIRETRDLENRIRLGLALACYAAFAVFYPSVYFGLLDPHAPDPALVPVLGWSMGIGSYPIAAGVFGAILATYAITGSLVVLFGRRAICSTFCTAAVMFQGTTVDAMKQFNRSSPVGRKYLSSRFSAVYSATLGLAVASLTAASLASYLDSTGAWRVSIGGADPTVFLFALYFSVLWYVMFVTIPFTGNYNCVTMGWCYTGAIAQAFQKIGFFKLKVRSREVCRECRTLDCARGCPIGLVDMVGHFRTQGEFRSSKCCGVGDCIEACPHDNLYISDVRHWIRARLGRPAAPRPRLPMARPRAGAGAIAARPSAPAAQGSAAPVH